MDQARVTEISDPRIWNWTNDQLERAAAAAHGKLGDARVVAAARAADIPREEAMELLDVLDSTNWA